ncbi:MAG: hypothetical protein AAFZ07_25280 [Actinomycetota bacterium]
MSDDDDLLADLARVLDQVDPPPDHVRELAIAAIELRSLDADLAALLDESDELAGAGVRSAADVVAPLVFEVGDIVIEVEVGADELHVQVVPPSATDVVVRAGSSAAERTSDDLGRVSFPLPDHRPVRLELVVDGRRVVTDWFVV